MTIVNIFLNSRRALVGVDTQAKDPQTGEMMEVSKMFPLVHINAVFAVRGTFGFFSPVHCAACIAPSFDSLVDELLQPEHLTRHWRDYAASTPGYAKLTCVYKEKAELYLVGWSQRAARMQGWFYSQKSAADGFERQAIPQSLVLGGGYPEIDALGVPDCPEVMYRMTKAQVALVRQLHPSDGVAGGRLVMAELTRHWLRIGEGISLDEDEDHGPRLSTLIGVAQARALGRS